jgi:amidase
VITEPLFDQALEEARDLDAYLKTNGRTIGPLHGIPITLKDQFNVKGVDTTLGYVGRSFKPAVEDAILVRILKGLGAVVFAKTNLPQSIMVCFVFPFSLSLHQLQASRCCTLESESRILWV